MKAETQLVPYSLEAATVEALKAKYMDVTVPPDDKAAYAMVMSGLRECREIRLAVDSWHKEKKEGIVKAGKHYDAERRRVHALVAPIEDHLSVVRQAEDDRKEAIKAEAERKKLERVEGIRAKIDGLRQLTIGNLNMTAARIAKLMDDVADIIISEEIFMEFQAEAEKVKAETLETLAKREKERSEWEHEQAAAKAETARLEKVRQEQAEEAKRLCAIQEEAAAKARKEREALDAEKRKLEAEKKALEDAKKAEKERQERAEWERKAQEEAKARAEAEAKEKIERKAKEAAERAEKERIEKERQEALKPDREKIIAFANTLLALKLLSLKNPDAEGIGNDALRQVWKIARNLLKKAEAL